MNDQPRPQPNNPLHNVTLAKMLEHLVQEFGWEELGQMINIRCFTVDPSIKSSLKFLRKTPWARTKVERLYLLALPTVDSEAIAANSEVDVNETSATLCDDSGTQDSGTQDSGTQDAGTQDAGTQDAGTPNVSDEVDEIEVAKPDSEADSL